MANRFNWRGPQVEREVKRRLARNLLKAALFIEADARRRAPVLTTRLQGSITHRVRGLRAEIGSKVEYAIYQELGTSKMRAQPYLRPAIFENRDAIMRIIAGG